MISTIKSIELNSFKLILKLNKLNNLFKNYPFILFFSYDFFNISDRVLLKKLLVKHNLDLLVCKKVEIEKIFSEKNKLKFLLSHNTILIFNQNKEAFSKATLKELFSYSKLKLIGGIFDSVAYRAKELKKFLILKDDIIKTKLMKELFFILYFSRNIIPRINLH